MRDPHIDQPTVSSRSPAGQNPRRRPDAGDADLDARLDALCAEGWALWEQFDRTVREAEFHPFVAADYAVVRRALLELRSPGRRFLEWGSASGIITIMADLLGYDAYGIEIDATLVETARGIARRHGSGARFVAGSFLPTGYRWRTAEGEQPMGTIDEGPSGYLTLGRALDEFDIVFGYPWGGEAPLMRDVMQRYGRPDALLLLFDASGELHRYIGGRGGAGTAA